MQVQIVRLGIQNYWRRVQISPFSSSLWQGEQPSKQAGQDSIEEGEEEASYPLNITESFFPGLLQILSNVLQRLLYVFDGFVGDGQSVPKQSVGVFDWRPWY